MMVGAKMTFRMGGNPRSLWFSIQPKAREQNVVGEILTTLPTQLRCSNFFAQGDRFDTSFRENINCDVLPSRNSGSLHGSTGFYPKQHGV